MELNNKETDSRTRVSILFIVLVSIAELLSVIVNDKENFLNEQKPHNFGHYGR